MAEQHSKSTVIIVNGADLSAFCRNSDFNRKPDVHDLTTYGLDDHKSGRGLGNGTTTLEGLYNTSGSGPRAVLKPLEAAGTTVTFIRRPEGTGTGKPQDSVPILVTNYVETSPVADYVAWSVELTHNGAVTSTTQP